MIEKIRQKLSERDAQVIANKNEVFSWKRHPSDFQHLGSPYDGNIPREPTPHGFKSRIEMLRNPKTDKEPFFRTIMRDNSVCMELAERFGYSPQEFFEGYQETYGDEAVGFEDYVQHHFYRALVIDICREIRMDTFSDDQIFEYLKVYGQEMEAMKFEAEKRVESLRDGFVPALRSFAEKYDIDINFEDIQFRLGDVRYDFFDEYHAASGEGTKGGDYERGSHTVRMLLDSFSRISAGTLQHEHLHAVSGQENILTLYYRGPKNSSIINTGERLGANRQRLQRKGDSFTWLNEAITERLNLEIEENEPAEGKEFEIRMAYPNERELFDLILKGGSKPISSKFFYQSYFESNTDNPEDLVHRKELYREISEAYGSPRFLVHIDDLVADRGIKKVLALFKESGKRGIEERWKELLVEQEEHVMGQ